MFSSDLPAFVGCFVVDALAGMGRTFIARGAVGALEQVSLYAGGGRTTGESGREGRATFTRRRLHSVQAIEALFTLLSPGLGPAVGLSGGDVRGRIGRRVL